ncbi:MAG: helix-turn-helix domain-containing protein [Flavobacterium sp.]
MKNFSIDKTPLEVQMELGKRFKTFRKQNKYSQAQLAQLSGVSLGSLKRFENKGQISLESLLQLSHFFNILNEFDSVFATELNLKEIEKLFQKP